jgi:hypothetical protein
MRIVFLALITVNVMLLIWGWRNGEVFFNARPSVVVDAEVSIGNIVLLSEGGLDGGANLLGEVGDDARCRMVGPFLEGAPAHDFVARLASIDVQSKVGGVDVSQVERYWVYLESFGSRVSALARLAELQKLDIDSYVILKGKLKYGISLGIFSQLSLAQDKVKSMELKGLFPLVEPVERIHREHWVVLEVGEGRKIDAAGWVDLLKERPNLETRQSFCVLDLASKRNFL